MEQWHNSESRTSQRSSAAWKLSCLNSIHIHEFKTKQKKKRFTQLWRNSYLIKLHRFIWVSHEWVSSLIAQFYYLLLQHLHLNERQRKRFAPPNKTFRKTGIHVQAFSWEKKLNCHIQRCYSSSILLLTNRFHVAVLVCWVIDHGWRQNVVKQWSGTRAAAECVTDVQWSEKKNDRYTYLPRTAWLFENLC